jgi:hypothetical protein
MLFRQRDTAGAETRFSPQRRGSDQRRDRMQLRQGCPRRFEVTGCCVCAHDEIESNDAIGAIVHRHATQIAFRCLGGVLVIAAIKSDFRSAQGRQRMLLALREHRRGFDQSALTPAQLGEPDESVRRHRRPRRGQFAGRCRELLLGFHPGAAPHAD